MSKIAVVGGGVIGLFTAWYLRKKGADVSVLDRGDFKNGCSYRNAGLIVPSHVVPLASPGMLRKGIKNLSNPSSTVGLRLAAEKDLIRWYIRFISRANSKHVKHSIPVLKDISLLSKDLFSGLKESGELDFPLWKKGLLMLYQSEKTGEELHEEAEIALKQGLEVDELTKSDVFRLEPDAHLNVSGGFHYHSDNHLNPSLLMHSLYTNLKKNGVIFIENCKVNKIDPSSKNLISLETDKGHYTYNELVITAGMWSPELLKQINIKIDVQPGKGYSFFVKTAFPIHFPALLSDVNVAVTPLGNGITQFGGGMEIGYSGLQISQKRIKQIIKGIEKFYPLEKNIDIIESQIWQGHRPCSFDGLPYIGQVPGYDNIFVGTGHSMMGLALAPATGLLLSELISGIKPSLNLDKFRPGR